jgi:hypothetical protein
MPQTASADSIGDPFLSATNLPHQKSVALHRIALSLVWKNVLQTGNFSDYTQSLERPPFVGYFGVFANPECHVRRPFLVFLITLFLRFP